MGWHGYGWGMGAWAWPMMGLFWIAVIVLIVLAVRLLAPGASASDSAGSRSPHGDAFAILDERFARGEIDAVEYRERKRALQAKR